MATTRLPWLIGYDQLGPLRVEIWYDPTLNLQEKDAFLWGELTLDTNPPRININPDVPLEMQRSILLHERLELINSVYDLGLNETALVTLELALYTLPSSCQCCSNDAKAIALLGGAKES